VIFETFWANYFLELRQGEVLRNPIPRTRVNKGKNKRKDQGSQEPRSYVLFSGSLSHSLGTPPLFKTRRHKLRVGMHERKHRAIRGDEDVVTRAIPKG
jgi:hypothetical protein